MTSPQQPRTTQGLDLEFPQSLAIYDKYEDAQKTVDFLSDRDFPVQNCVIVGTDLKQVERITGRPWYGGGILFVAALFGLPPLLVMAAVAGALKMPYWVFLPTIFVGRALRFWLVLAGVEFILH